MRTKNGSNGERGVGICCGQKMLINTQASARNYNNVQGIITEWLIVALSFFYLFNFLFKLVLFKRPEENIEVGIKLLQFLHTQIHMFLEKITDLLMHEAAYF